METARAFAHDALFYRDEQGFLDAVVPFIQDGLSAGDAVVAVTTKSNIELLQRSLGSDVAAVRTVDAEQWYVRPTRTISGYDRVLEELLADGADYVRVIGEVEFGDTFSDHAAWTRYESVLNRVFEHAPAWIVCPYDVGRLPPHVIDHARRTHPQVWDGGLRRTSSAYLSPEALLEQVAEATPAPVGPPALSVTVDPDRVDGTTHMAESRALVERTLAGAGLDHDRRAEFLVAMNEIATNALRHGAGRVRLALWLLPGWVTCEISDQGPGWHDPFSGYLPPPDGSIGGMGLWIARQMTDRLAIGRRDGRTCVRVSVKR